jgi:hypothetical protein
LLAVEEENGEGRKRRHGEEENMGGWSRIRCRGWGRPRGGRRRAPLLSLGVNTVREGDNVERKKKREWAAERVRGRWATRARGEVGSGWREREGPL